MPHILKKEAKENKPKTENNTDKENNVTPAVTVKTNNIKQEHLFLLRRLNCNANAWPPFYYLQ